MRELLAKHIHPDIQRLTSLVDGDMLVMGNDEIVGVYCHELK